MSKTTVANWQLYYVDKQNQENTFWEKPKDYTTQKYDIYWTDDNNPDSEQIKNTDALRSKNTELLKAVSAKFQPLPRDKFSEQQIVHSESSKEFPDWTLKIVGDFSPIPFVNPNVDCTFETDCPITHEILDQFSTVKLSDGHCYSTTGLQGYKGSTSPLTRADFKPEDKEIIKKIQSQTAYYTKGTEKLFPKEMIQRFPAFPRYMGYDQLLKLGESGYVWNLKDDRFEQAPDFFSNPPNYSTFTMDDGTLVTAINPNESNDYTSGWMIGGDRKSVWKKTYFIKESPVSSCGDPAAGESCDGVKWINETLTDHAYDADRTGESIISSEPIVPPLKQFMETNKIETESDCIQYLREFPDFRLMFPPVILLPLLSDIFDAILRLKQQNNPDLVKQCLTEQNVSSCMTCKKKNNCPTSPPPVLASKLQEYQRAVGVYERIQEIKGSLAAGPPRRDANEKKKYNANGFTEEEQNQRYDLQIELNTLEKEICSGEKNGHPMPKFCPPPQSGGKKTTRRKQRKSTRRKSKRRPNKTRR